MLGVAEEIAVSASACVCNVGGEAFASGKTPQLYLPQSPTALELQICINLKPVLFFLGQPHAGPASLLQSNKEHLFSFLFLLKRISLSMLI